MSLLWFRMDCHFASHDKMLALLSDPSPKRYQAGLSWAAAIGWSVSAGTDGRIPRHAFPFIHATEATARLLVKYRLWRELDPTTWEITNFAERQQTARVTEAKQAAAHKIATKGACTRWHEKGCWSEERGCSIA